jgi:hypothetical protein
MELDLHQPATSAKSALSQSGNRKLEPIAPRSAFVEKRSVVPRVEMMPPAPAASAVLRIAPAFVGLLMP